MPHIIRNENIEIVIHLPHEGYNLARFDWTGKIVDVRYKGISLAGSEKDAVKPGEFIGMGFYNEFGIEKAVGYQECKPGGWFHKIGVGLLKKVKEEYEFYQPYEIRPLDFEVKKSDTFIEFKSLSPMVNGYGYRLKKKIKLSENGFDIEYELANTGSGVIETMEYNHNFIMLGNDQIGKHYQLTFPFPLYPGEVGEALNPRDVIIVKDHGVWLNGTPVSPFFYSYINGRERVQAQWEMVNKSLGVGISELGTFETQKVNLWGWKGAMSPEFFHEVYIRPGEKQSWCRSYKVFETI